MRGRPGGPLLACRLDPVVSAMAVRRSFPGGLGLTALPSFGRTSAEDPDVLAGALEDGERDVVDRYAAGCPCLRLSVVGVTVEDDVGAVGLDGREEA